MKKIIVCALSLAFAMTLAEQASAAPSTACHTAKPAKAAHWSWRIIDGRKCWYPGAPKRAKASLYWPTRKAVVRRVPRPAPPPVDVAPADHPLLSSVWPALPPPITALSFKDRWQEYIPARPQGPPRQQWPSPSFAIVTPAGAAEALPERERPTSSTITPALLTVFGPGLLIMIILTVIELDNWRRRRRPFKTRFA